MDAEQRSLTSTKGIMRHHEWVNFKELRAQLDFAEVLRHYGAELKGEGDQRLGYCPLPGHGGSRRSPSFSANLERGIFHCFGCQAKGNLLDFAALMEGADPKDGAALRKVALGLKSKFRAGDSKPGAKPHERQADLFPEGQQVVTNAELDFELQDLDSGHPYLPGRKFAKATIDEFGLGFCSRGSLQDRIAIPLRDAAGRLIGYAGRVVDDVAIADENPKYRFPAKRLRKGVWHDFKKTLFLYNGHRFRSPREHLAVVEGFPSVWWLTQNGFPNVVATMGAECSEEQAALIVSLVKPGGHVWAIPDGDRAGEKFGASLLSQIAQHRFIRWLKLGDGKQPTDLSVRDMKAAFAP